MSQTKQDKLDELKSKARLQQEEMSKTNSEIIRLTKEIWHDTTGINIGDTVSFIDGKETKTGVLCRISAIGFIYPFVRLHKKDGSLGQRESRVWRSESLKKI